MMFILRALGRLVVLGLLVLAFVVGLLSCFSGAISRSVIFPGPMDGRSDAYYQSYFEPQDAVVIKSDEGANLRGWLINRGPSKPLVVMYGGNAMNVGAFHSFATQDTSRSYLLVNYRSYGGSEGSPSQDAIVADSLKAIEWAKKKRCGEAKLILVGYSIGSGVAMQVAAQVQPDGLVLICPFDSVEAVAQEMLGFWGAFMVRQDAFLSLDIAPRMTCPVSIFAGTRDSVIAPHRTQSLIDAFTQVKPHVLWFEAGHNDLMSGPAFDAAFAEALAQ